MTTLQRKWLFSQASHDWSQPFSPAFLKLTFFGVKQEKIVVFRDHFLGGRPLGPGLVESLTDQNVKNSRAIRAEYP